MGVRENRVEKYLQLQVEKLGGLTRKWVSPGISGVPDRIVFYKGRVWFIEVKVYGGKLSSMQEREINRLLNQNADVRVLYGEDAVDVFIEELKQC